MSGKKRRTQSWVGREEMRCVSGNILEEGSMVKIHHTKFSELIDNNKTKKQARKNRQLNTHLNKTDMYYIFLWTI